MNIREITVGELPAFVESEEYAKLQPKPITPLRAYSQFKNPHAHAEDLALVFAAENGNLLALAGILPHKTFLEPQPIYSNSGWWANPDSGRQWALPVLLKALLQCGQRMILTDCTAYTKSVLEKTGLFTFVPAIEGSRYFLRFYSGKLLRRKGKNRLFFSLFSLVDNALNTLLSPFFSYRVKELQNDRCFLKSVKSLDAEHARFIEKNPGNSILTQDIEKLNWIIQNPWITQNTNVLDVSYPFTWKVDSFSQEFLEIRKGNELVALLFFSVRDNHASVPFIFYSENSLNSVSSLLWRHLAEIKADSLYVYRHELNKALKKSGRKYLFSKKIVRFAGYSKTLQPTFAEKEFSFQDGEADVAFT